jgi:hypothetical protein
MRACLVSGFAVVFKEAGVDRTRDLGLPVSDELGSALSFGLCDSLLYFSAAVRAFVGKVDLRRAPMGFNISNVHRQQSSAGGADICSYFDFVVLDIGGHVGPPSVRKVR